ncbi:MAG: DUF72 domain-containing protein [Gemmatimonadota bacterium]
MSGGAGERGKQGKGKQRFYIGTQGWNYGGWGGRFYPAGVRAGDRLEQYSRVFDTVEVDSTFYAMPPAGRFASWYERTPAHFHFTAKLPRDITHDARLVGADELLYEFCDRASELREKLGPLLVQLPPDMGVRERGAVEAFVRALPRELEFTVEFRDPAWFDEQTFDLLREFDVSLAVSVGPWLRTEQALAVAAEAPGAFRYLRWLGAPRHQEITSSLVAERDADIAAWAELILTGEQPRTYAYFNNDYQGHSPDSARRLQKLVGVEPADPDRLKVQRELFG